MKKRELRKFFVLMVFAFLSVTTVTAVTLSGNVKETSTGEGLIQASVRLLAARDSSLVGGVVTNDNGRYTIPNVRPGKYIVEASYIGYETQLRDITVGDRDIRLKPFELKEGSVLLKEATVVGVRTPITVKEDTVEFSAESYKTQPNSVVEDLLKRLPGVEVGSDGKITANGKSISKILVDGKEFFADDPSIASKNLPADMLEKIQVVDRKSDLARLTGVDDGEDETVINLSVKKGMKNGWFGNIEGGYGTDEHYKGSFNINRFWNDNQITFLGGANNINEPIGMGGGGRFRRFGGQNGLNNSQALGMNFNVGNGEKFRVGGNVFYSHEDRDSRSVTERTNLFADSTSSSYSRRMSRDKGHNVRGDFRMLWKPDSFNTFEFRPNISLNFNNSNSNDSSSTFAGGRDMGREVTRSLNNADSRGNSFELGGRLIFTHNFRSRPGRSFSVMLNYSMSNLREKENTYSFNRFYLLNDSVDLYDQYANNHTWSNTVGGRLTWTEPIGRPSSGNFLTLAYRFSYRWNNADKLTYDHPVTFPDGWEGMPVVDENLVFNQELSNRFRNDYMNQEIELGYRHVSKKGNFNAGVSLVPQRSKSIDLLDHNKDLARSVLNYAPFLRYQYKFSKTRSMRINYRGRSSQPSMTQMQPVADMSDPLNITIGNPNLDPSFSHNIGLRFNDYNEDKQRSIMVRLDGSLTQNSIVNKTTYDRETGGRITEYVNVNGVWNARLMNIFSMPMPFCKQLQFNNHIFVNYNNNIGFNNGLRNRSGSLMVNESMGISWRPEYIELELRPYYSFQTVHNTIQTSANRDVHTYGGTFNAIYTSPFGLVLSSDINYSATSGYATGFDTKTWMWNAAVSYQFLRDRSLSLTLRAYDLLGQCSAVQRNVTANYISDVRSNTLTRYVMASVTYKFNTFGKGKTPGRNGYNDGPEEGGPRGGRRFMGPPPGGGPGGPGRF